MNNYQKSLIEEHSNLVVRTQKLHNYIYSCNSDDDNKVEFANKCIQLSAMKKYEESLRARLENAGVVFDNGTYFEQVGSITPVVPTFMPVTGNDYDVDSTETEETENKENE